MAKPLLPPHKASENSEASTRNPVLYRASLVFLALTVSFVIFNYGKWTTPDQTRDGKIILDSELYIDPSEGMKRMQGKFQALKSKTMSDSSIVIIRNDKNRKTAGGEEGRSYMQKFKGMIGKRDGSSPAWAEDRLSLMPIDSNYGPSNHPPSNPIPD